MDTEVLQKKDQAQEDWSNMEFVLMLAEAITNITCKNPEIINSK